MCHEEHTNSEHGGSGEEPERGGVWVSDKSCPLTTRETSVSLYPAPQASTQCDQDRFVCAHSPDRS